MERLFLPGPHSHTLHRHPQQQFPPCYSDLHPLSRTSDPYFHFLGTYKFPNPAPPSSTLSQGMHCHVPVQPPQPEWGAILDLASLHLLTLPPAQLSWPPPLSPSLTAHHSCFGDCQHLFTPYHPLSLIPLIHFLPCSQSSFETSNLITLLPDAKPFNKIKRFLQFEVTN